MPARRRRLRAIWVAPAVAVAVALGAALLLGFERPASEAPAPAPRGQAELADGPTPDPPGLPASRRRDEPADLDAPALSRAVSRLAALRIPVPARRASRLGRGNGELAIVPGRSAGVGGGAPRTYAIEVERGLGLPRRETAELIERTLSDRRGWSGGGSVALRRTASGEAPAFRVTLASPSTTDRLCAPLLTQSRYSCFRGGRAVLNARRWVSGAKTHRGSLPRYRRYMVNHEVGHALGYGHAVCPARGRRAPVMVQQTKSLGGCRANPWPLEGEGG